MKTVLGTWLVALAVSMVGCATPVDEGSSSIGTGNPRMMPRETPGEDAGPGEIPPEDPDPSTATLIVQNDSSQTIFYLYVSPTIESDWGPDQLGASNVLPPGESFQLNDIPCGVQYDLMAADAYNEPLAATFENYFACGDTLTWRLY
jgi:hypothetical protein